jgi:hypothetical protein
MVQPTEQKRAVIGMVFESATFFVCLRWPRTATDKDSSYVNGVEDAETASESRKAAEEIISEPGKWQPAGRINPSTAYVGPGASPKIKAMVFKLLETAKMDVGTGTVLKNLLGNIESQPNSYEQCFNGVLFAGEGCM